MLVIKEKYTNETENCYCGDSTWYEPYTDNLGNLFASMQKEYGRCVSKIYRDNCFDGSVDHIGWVFEKRKKYSDCQETYIQHVWVSFKQVISL